MVCLLVCRIVHRLQLADTPLHDYLCHHLQYCQLHTLLVPAIYSTVVLLYYWSSCARLSRWPLVVVSPCRALSSLAPHWLQTGDDDCQSLNTRLQHFDYIHVIQRSLCFQYIFLFTAHISRFYFETMYFLNREREKSLFNVSKTFKLNN